MQVLTLQCALLVGVSPLSPSRRSSTDHARVSERPDSKLSSASPWRRRWRWKACSNSHRRRRRRCSSSNCCCCCLLLTIYCCSCSSGGNLPTILDLTWIQNSWCCRCRCCCCCCCCCCCLLTTFCGSFVVVVVIVVVVLLLFTNYLLL